MFVPIDKVRTGSDSDRVPDSDQAIGIPKTVTRVIRGAIGLLFVGIVVVGILRSLNLLSE
jgi:hypothetical protein